MSRGKGHRRWRVKPGARHVRLPVEGLRDRPLGEVRAFEVGALTVAATHHAPGRWLLHTGAVPAERLAGAQSVVLERQDGADGGWGA